MTYNAESTVWQTPTVDIQCAPDYSFLPTRRTCACDPERLNCLSRRELTELGSTVIDGKVRYRWEEKHPARFVPYVPEKFIKLFTHPGETVLDPFCGSGTTNVVALQLGRSSIGIDVNPRSAQMTYERLQNASLHLFNGEHPRTHHRVINDSCLSAMAPIPPETIDLIVTSPPYFDVIDYEHEHPEQWGNIHNYPRFLERMEEAFKAMWRVLKPHGWLVVVTQDVFKGHAKCPIHADYILICRDKIGFTVWSTQIYILNYSTGGRLVYGYPTSYYPKNDHEYILIFRKEDATNHALE